MLERELSDLCEQIARTRARNFYPALAWLPREHRRALCALYAFCRAADDLVDDGLPTGPAREGLRQLLRELDEPRSPQMQALAWARARFGIPREPLVEILRGVEMDLQRRRYTTFEDLRLYCERVASAVGIACLPVLGARNASARQAASDLGIAMQLTNILRDLKEDAARGRIYLPQEDLARFGVREEQVARGVPPFPDLMRFEVGRARLWFRRGLRLLRHLPPRTRPMPAILAAIYSGILDQIERRGYNVHRAPIRLPPASKWLRAAGALVRAALA